MNKYYVYAYICPISNNLKYIGKGTRDRCSVHWMRARTGAYVTENKRLVAWLNILILLEKKPIIVKIASGLTEQEAFELEALLISLEKRNKDSQLLNKKKGGTN